VPTHLIGNDAFQEADVVGITRPCTKIQLPRGKRARSRARREGSLLHRQERPPRPGGDRSAEDITAAKAPYIYPESVNLPSYKPAGAGDPALVRKAVDMMLAAERPILYVGRRCRERQRVGAAAGPGRGAQTCR